MLRKLIPQLSMSLAMRIFLMCAITIGVSLGAIVGITYSYGNDVSSKSVERALNQSLAIKERFTQLRERELLIELDGFATDPAFNAYIASAMLSDTAATGVDIASIADLVKERRDDLGLDFIVILNPDGQIVVHSEKPGLGHRDYSQHPLIAPVIEELIPAAGIWIENDRMYQAAVVPLSIDYDLIGFALAGSEIGTELAAEIKQISGSDVIYSIADSQKFIAGASTLELLATNDVLQTLNQQRASLQALNTKQRKSLNWNNQDYIIDILPIGYENKNQQCPILVILSSRDQFNQSYQKILGFIIVSGIFAMLLAMGLSYILSSKILKPVQSLAEAAEAATIGDFKTDLHIEGNDELSRLGKIINTLLSDLRDKQDMQHFLSQISENLHAESNEQDAALTVQASTQSQQIATTTLVGIDFSELLHDAKSLKEQQQKTEQFIQTLNQAIQPNQAIFCGIGVKKGALVFAPETSLFDGYVLMCQLTQIISKQIQRPFAPLKLALCYGELAINQLEVSKTQSHLAQGPVVRQALALLADASSGQCLASNTAFKTLKPTLTQHRIRVQATQGKTSGRKLCLLDLSYQGPTDDPALDATIINQAPPAKSLNLSPGSALSSRYQIVQVLGKGNMGIVYKAMDNELGELVAIKLLHQDISSDSELVERMKSEIKLARRVTHQNILRTFDLGEIEGMPFISMEYVRGMTLSFLLENTGRLPYNAALRVAKQLCLGLQAVHKIGVLHRDIKPENVILEPNGNVKLMDFGIARVAKHDALSEKYEAGLFVGTPRYASPEQVQAKSLDVRTDIYSAGILMTEIFTGKRPIQGASLMELCKAQVNTPPTPPSELWPEIPEALERILLTCIQKSPDMRYSNVDELLEALNALSA